MSVAFSVDFDLSNHEVQVLRDQAQRTGLSLEEYTRSVIRRLANAPNARTLRALPRDERNRILEAQAESAAALYEADLALPPAERELTALTALDGDEFYDAAR